jgi:hypothetical protein
MSDAAKSTYRKKGWLKVIFRVVLILGLATLIGGGLNLVAKSLNARTQPAGFRQGILQGALMPMAMPNLLIGKDVTIYSQNNTGLSYKLGYTAGVNVCGAIFFGLFFWRVTRWRRGATKE